ncbi:MAG: serine hydrolase domain-containing protein [Ignavibacteriaceae bacterium]
MKKIFLSLFCLFSFALIQAQTFNITKMDSLFSLIDKNDKGMGSISLFQNGEEVYQKAFGFSDFENNLLADSKTKYRIGSVTKTFTAVIILQMIEENKITLESPLSLFFPQIVNSGKITIEQLLRHRSGIHNFTNDSAYVTYMDKPKIRDELLEIFSKLPSDFTPGEKFSYSNTGYVLLSFIAEKIDNKSFQDILIDRIIRPLQLENTFLGNKIVTINNEALSYNKIENWQRSVETDLSIPIGAGAIVSTPTDLNIFYNALFSGKLVSQTSLEKMTTLVDGYGMGLFQIPFYERKAFGHTGGIDAFQTASAYFPDEKFAVSFISNGVVVPRNDIMIGALSIFFGRDYTLPDFKPSLLLSSKDLDKYLGTYSTPTFPLKITISKKENVLMGQATGQPAFPLDPYEVDKFKFDSAGLKIEFVPVENKMILRQSGMQYELIKE